MKCLFIFLLILPLSVFARKNAIDSLKTDEDVYQFLKSRVDSSDAIDLKKFTFKPDPDEPDFNHLYDSLVNPKWGKADFDNNGETDLLISGFTGDEYGVYLILARAANHFELQVVQNTLQSARNAYLLPRVIKYQNKAMLLAYHPDRRGFRRRDNVNAIVADTLIYKFGQFVEYNRNPRVNKFDSISYGANGGMDFGPSDNINVKSNGMATYDIHFINKEEQIRLEEIEKAQFQKITDIVNYLDFSKLDSFYRVRGVTDMAIASITFYFPGNKEVRIYDYGMQGTYLLAELYGLLDELIDNERKLIDKK